MLTHDQVQQQLSTAGVGEAQLISRYSDDALSLPQSHVQVFLPDWHLLTPDDARQFPKCHFQLDVQLESFMNQLLQLKKENAADVVIWQLGDLLDEWRALQNRGMEVEVDAIVSHYSRIINMLRFSAPLGVKAKMLAGNHDFVLHQLDGWDLPRFRVIENMAPTGGSVLVIHGDVFDTIERAPDGLQKLVVQIAKSHATGVKDLGPKDAVFVSRVNAAAGKGDDPIVQGDGELQAENSPDDGDFVAINVVDGDRDNPRHLTRFFSSARKLALKLKERRLDIRAMVIGHTHVARIVRGDRGDGVPFVLMDCGAWFESCRLPADSERLKSAQVGVLLGNEMRIYQIGREIS